MKIVNSSAKSILLSLFFVVPLNSIGAVQNTQLIRSAQHEKNSIDRIVARYIELYKRYQKCKTGICTPQEQKQLQQEPRTLRNEVLFVGIGLIALIAGSTLAALYIPRLRKKTKARAATARQWAQYEKEDEEKRKLQEAELQRGQEIENEEREKERKKKEAEDEHARQELEKQQEETKQKNEKIQKVDLEYQAERQREKNKQEANEIRIINTKYIEEITKAFIDSETPDDAIRKQKEIKEKYREKYPDMEFR